MPDPYFGAEFLESTVGSETVQELKAGVGMIVGTAPIGDVHTTPEERAKYINKTIQIRRREDIAAKFGAHRAGFTIPAALDAIFDQAGKKGVGVIDVVNVYDPDTHASVGDVTNLDIIGRFTASGEATGLKKAYEAYHRFGRFPKIIVCPGFAGLTGVRGELEAICNRILARTIIDAPVGVTMQQVLEARGPLGSFDLRSNSRRTCYCWPHVQVVDLETGEERTDPYSARIAGVWLSSIQEWGYHHSPSNRPIVGIEDTTQPVLYIPGDASSDIQGLRGAGLITTEARHGKPPHTSGNRSAAYPTDPDMRNFLHVQFTEDMLIEEGLFFLDEQKDRIQTNQSIELLEERMNLWLQSKTVGDNPTILDGQFRFDRKKTTVATATQGQFHYSLPWAPVGIGERLTTTQFIDLNLLANAYGLAAS
ncbi:hypothetical protein [Epibacterium ulvae]|uniref:hypothetical protein n=1 Tax=Epibacterium ulvae TaxID=1156985 RepID=UPI00248F6C61|nr:hypothetical protein [Epibacterium ulvae]